MNIKTKLPNAGTTIFAIMSKMAREHNAINLSQGFPGFDIDPELSGLVSRYMEEGMNQYAPMNGVPVLLEAISRKTNRCYEYEPSTDCEICVTSGATEALFCAISAVVKPGDEVIIFEPAYDSYIPAIELNGGIPVPVELKYPDYSIDWDEVKDKFNTKTRLIITNTPHNPTGAVWSPADMENLAAIMRNSDALLISDEVYEHIIFDNKIHQSALLYPELRERAFTISSFGKSFHTTGWKMGYCIAPELLMTEFKKIHQYVVFCSPTPFQYAIAKYLEQPSRYEYLPAFYQGKRDVFQSLIKQTGFKALPCGGTYFQLASYRQLSKEPDMDFAARLTREYGVASIPISVFFNSKRDDKVLRFCFAKQNDEMERAVELLGRV